MNKNNDSITNIELFRLCQKYQSINSFISNHNNISYSQFDRYLVEDLNLFISNAEINLELLENHIDKILGTLKHIKNIFKRPLLHLKEDSMVMPAEVANRIDNDTIIHISTHSELWDGLEDDTIKPSKLLTRVYKDDYSIYENKVFCHTIDFILNFTKTNLRMLKDLIFSKQLVEFNILERTNHLNYFLALGKLHIGYFHQFDNNVEDVQRCIDKLEMINEEVSKGLNTLVYKNNERYRGKIKLHKTNILAMHKDYRRIYSLIKSLKKNEDDVKKITNSEIAQLHANYFNYIQCLIVFSLSHLGFKICESQKLDLSSLNITSQFKRWKLSINKLKLDSFNVIKLSINKDKVYDIILIPTLLNSKEKDDEIRELRNKVMGLTKANEYIVCTPFENKLQDFQECFISISSLDSFRRIQQILLRSMINSDNQRVDCPFCKEQLKQDVKHSNEYQTVHSCKACKTMIVDGECPNSKQAYSYTDILYFKEHNLWNKDYIADEEWLMARQIEGQMFFRNITKINGEREIMCPFCNEVHNY